MRPRKVVVMIEMTIDLSLQLLRDKGLWTDLLVDIDNNAIIHQVQANVVKVEKGGKKG